MTLFGSGFRLSNGAEFFIGDDRGSLCLKPQEWGLPSPKEAMEFAERIAKGWRMTPGVTLTEVFYYEGIKNESSF